VFLLQLHLRTPGAHSTQKYAYTVRDVDEALRPERSQRQLRENSSTFAILAVTFGCVTCVEYLRRNSRASKRARARYVFVMPCVIAQASESKNMPGYRDVGHRYLRVRGLNCKGSIIMYEH